MICDEVLDLPLLKLFMRLLYLINNTEEKDTVSFVTWYFYLCKINELVVAKNK